MLPLLSKFVDVISDEDEDYATSTEANAVEAVQDPPHPCREGHPGLRCSLSYLSVSVFTASLARGLRRTIVNKKLSSPDHDAPPTAKATVNVAVSDCGSDGDSASSVDGVPTVTVAVAIPEGILLPLAISAVHALNWPLQLTPASEEDEAAGESATAAASAFSAVLVPIDPSDAPRRLEQMLRTCRPAVILTAADADRDRLVRAGWGDAVVDVRDVLFLTDSAIAYEHRRNVLEMSRTIGSQHGDGEDDENNSSMPWHEWILRCEASMYGGDVDAVAASLTTANRVSHVVFTSGTTGVPKGCVSSVRSLLSYLRAKNASHHVTCRSRVLLASSVSFDPCLGDVLATFSARATLVVPRRCRLLEALLNILQDFEVSHCLCTPTLWSSVMASSTAAAPSSPLDPSSPPSFDPARPGPHLVPHLRVLALGGEAIPTSLVRTWARPSAAPENSSGPEVPSEAGSALRLFSTYGVTEACVYQTGGEVFRDQPNKGGAASGHVVGRALAGVGVRICAEIETDRLVDALPDDDGVRVGEVVLYGSQVDDYHSYLHQPDLSKLKFVRDEYGRFCYRTGMFSTVVIVVG
jgi:acyl-CoA synthetase (AMP-forming)/AMP-acid ligase II